MKWISVREYHPKAVGDLSSLVLIYDGNNIGFGWYDYINLKFVIEKGNVNPECITHWSWFDLI